MLSRVYKATEGENLLSEAFHFESQILEVEDRTERCAWCALLLPPSDQRIALRTACLFLSCLHFLSQQSARRGGEAVAIVQNVQAGSGVIESMGRGIHGSAHGPTTLPLATYLHLHQLQLVCAAVLAAAGKPNKIVFSVH